MLGVARGVPLVSALMGLLACMPSGGGQRRAASPPPAAVRPRQSATVVRQYQRMEIALPIRVAYANPFDPEEVEVVAEVQTPSGRTFRVPGFYYQPYARSRDAAGREVLTPSGQAVFRMRIVSGEVGRHRYRIMLGDISGLRSVGSGGFTVLPGASKGYVRRSPVTPYYLQYDRGDAYFPIGENLCWPGGGGTYDYDQWMRRLADHRANYLRLWLVNEWNALGLEHLPRSEGDGNGLGRYDQEAAWRIDYVLEQAERLGLHVLMCIDSFNSLATGTYGMWDRYPYNAIHGGPCERPGDFFRNEEAKRLFRQRLRYLVARWGYSPAVFAWEFWNEVDIVSEYDSAAVAAWHQEMARYLRSVDPWVHLITTSHARTEGDPAVDSLPEMDLVQSHHYGSHDLAGIIARVSREKAAAYGKPHYFGEFGADWLAYGDLTDADGVHLHNGLWAAMLSGSAGTAMLWWWDNYVDPQQLYYHFAPVAAFAETVDWLHGGYAPVEPTSLRYVAGREPETRPSVVIEPAGESWEDGSPYNQPHIYQVGGDGTVTGFDQLSRVLHGMVNHPTWHNPATFVVSYPSAGRFEVHVDGVSGYGGAALRISLDGEEALAADFPDTLPADYETMRQYDGWYGIEVPAGPHTVVVEGTGPDWCYVSYRLTNYLTSPNLRVLALANADSLLVWVQNKDNTWWNLAEGVQPLPANPSEVTFAGLAPGEYGVQQWDTYTGAVTELPPCQSPDGTIVVTTPGRLTADVAYQIRRR